MRIEIPVSITTTTTTTTTITPHPLESLLCCSGAARLAPSRVVIYLWPHSKIFIHYHNRHPQKQRADMAPRSLEKMSQTFTTTHSVTIRLYSLRRYPNYTPVRRCNHIFSLHSDDTYATSPITFACTCASTIPSNTSPCV